MFNAKSGIEPDKNCIRERSVAEFLEHNKAQSQQKKQLIEPRKRLIVCLLFLVS